ncbi:MAG: hypothetical protein K0R49_71 [Burkholderiales bacterium]|jgi:hypothetical protein|nr:hypothetical protein [Burkholderiales bacterium]
MKLESIADYYGEWNIPNTDDKFYGKILQEKNGSYLLEIMGNFSNAPPSNLIHKHDFINGITTNGKKITLTGVIEHSKNCSYPGSIVTKYNFNEAFIGYHFNQNESIKFDAISIPVNYLNKWMGIDPFTVKPDVNNLTMVYTTPEILKISLDTVGLNIEIKSEYTCNSNPSGYNIKEDSFIKLYKNKAEDFNELLNSINWLITFLSVCYYQPIQLPYISCHSNSQEDISYVLNRPIEYNNTNSSLFLVTYTNIKNDFVRILQWWFENKEKLKVIGYIFKSLLKVDYAIPLEVRFSQSIQMVETFHRKFKNNEYIPKDAIEPYILCLKNVLKKEKTKKLNNKLIGKIKYALTSKMKYAYEPSLMQRLKELITHIPQNILTQTIITDDKFITNICSLRNYYTHWDQIEGSPINEQKIYDYAETLRLILIINLLKEMRFADDNIINIFKRNKTVKFNRSLIWPEY